MSEIDKFLELERQLTPYKKILSQASDVILDENVSKYPIFIVHQQELEMGVSLEDWMRYKKAAKTSTTAL